MEIIKTLSNSILAKIKESVENFEFTEVLKAKNGSKLVALHKKGDKNKIKIKESHKGLFTEYCNGKVTEECISKGKNSPDPKIRKRATFAANARKWKH